MADRRWKVWERRIAAELGGRRVGATGQATPDVVTATLAVEVKCREIPGWLADAIDQARANAPDGLTPVVVLVTASPGRKARRVVCMGFADFQGVVTDSGE